MKFSVFEFDQDSPEVNGKVMAVRSRKRRLGARAGTDQETDAALAVTGKVLMFSTCERRLAEILRRIHQASPTDRQIVEGIEESTHECRRKAKTLATDVYEAFDLSPHRIAASVEGGILIAYRRDNDLRLEIEIDNDGDIVGAISTRQRVIQTESIDLPAKLSRLVRDFRLSRQT